jgi:hypothetical protein
MAMAMAMAGVASSAAAPRWPSAPCRSQKRPYLITVLNLHPTIRLPVSCANSSSQKRTVKLCATASQPVEVEAKVEAEAATTKEDVVVEESSSGFEDMEDIEVEKGYKMSKVCDKLIDVFLVEKTKPEEWRILLAFSEEWVKIRKYFYSRCKSQAKLADNPKRTADLLKLARRMKEVRLGIEIGYTEMPYYLVVRTLSFDDYCSKCHVNAYAFQVDDDMQRHDALLAKIEESPMDLDTIVARHRKDFTGDFFQHLHLLCDASYENLNRREGTHLYQGLWFLCCS